MNLYNTIISGLKSNNIQYIEYDHDPILSYEDAEREKQKFNWEWVESKNVFMTNKKWKYFVFVTVQWEKVDFNKMKKITWEKLSIASWDEVKDIIHCVPWCVAPFWFSDDIMTIIDNKIFTFDNYLFSPWVTTITIQLNPKDLKVVFEGLKNKIFI